MTRVHKRKPGSRHYKDYASDRLEECLHRLQSGEISQRYAEKQYRIPRSTLKNKLKAKHVQPVGRPTILSMEEEKMILQRVQALCDYGFPATTEDVCYFIKCYLDTKNRVVKQFKNNMPGSEFMFYFLRRHKAFSTRLTSNIKRARAAVSAEIIKEFHEQLTKELQNVPASNIWNYDETSLVNDPGRQKCVMKRGTRYPERVINHTKAGVSLMFCGSAEGEVLPPYCVYKSTAVLMDSWVRGGPEGCRYNRSKSGWFDETLFENWFNDVLLPRMKKQTGTKVMIGDNLSSHISEAVVRKCLKYNIKFICLPPNSTHLTQPLDVAYFHPLKVEWRKILNEFRKTKVGQKETSIPKNVFPTLLKKLIERLERNGKTNVVSGFRKCGIFPLDVKPLLERLPKPESSKEDDAAAMDTSLINILTEMRQAGPSRAKKSKTIKVSPGKSVSEKDLEVITTKEVQKVAKGSSTITKSKTGLKLSDKVKKRKRKADSQAELEVGSNIEPEIQPGVDEERDPEAERPTTSQPVAHKLDIGSYVQVINGAFEGYYASIVAKSFGDEWELNYFMEKSSYQGKYWVLKENDLDSREECDLALVKGFPDEKGRFTFKDI